MRVCSVQVIRTWGLLIVERIEESTRGFEAIKTSDT
jgi:hypothetical protein